MIQCVVCEDWLHGRVSPDAGSSSAPVLETACCNVSRDQLSDRCTSTFILTCTFVCAAPGLCGYRVCGAAGDDL